MTTTLQNRRELAKLLSRIESGDADVDRRIPPLPLDGRSCWVVGVTGPPGAGKSSLLDALITRLREDGGRVAVVAVDPSSPRSGGAVLGDRLRMTRHLSDSGVFIRSLASRGEREGLAAAVPSVVRALAAAGFDWVLVETVGVGQGAVGVGSVVDTTVLVQAPGGGDAVQASKAGVAETADILVVNKSDLDGADVLAQHLRLQGRLGGASVSPAWSVPVVCTSTETDLGVEELAEALAAHRRHLSPDAVAARRQERRVCEWRARAVAGVARCVAESLSDGQWDHLVADVASARCTPGDAAAQVVRNWRGRRQTPRVLGAQDRRDPAAHDASAGRAVEREDST